jgi:hypothetical protein
LAILAQSRFAMPVSEKHSFFHMRLIMAAHMGSGFKSNQMLLAHKLREIDVIIDFRLR